MLTIVLLDLNKNKDKELFEVMLHKAEQQGRQLEVFEESTHPAKIITPHIDFSIKETGEIDF